MKRLLLLSFYYTPDLCAGSFRTAALIDALLPQANAAHIQIDLITTMPNRYAHYHVATQEREQYKNFTIHRITLPAHQSGFIDQARAFSVYYFAVKKWLRKNKNYDGVFATSSRLFTAFLGARAATQCRCPLFLDIRDIFTETMDALLPKKIKKIFLPIFKYAEKYTLKKATILNLVSPGFVDYFSKKINPDCKLLCISNGVDTCFENIAYDKKIQNPVIVLYAGNIGSGQAIEKIIPSLATHAQQNYIFRIIGDGGKLPALKNACANLNNVEIINPVHRDQLILEYQNADILFLHLENCAAFERVLPSKIFEYAMSGKPILAGVSGYSKKFLNEHVAACEIFTPCDANDAFEKLKRLLDTSSEKRDTKLFYEKFNRNNLMKTLAQEIIQLHQQNPACKLERYFQ